MLSQSSAIAKTSVPFCVDRTDGLLILQLLSDMRDLVPAIATGRVPDDLFKERVDLLALLCSSVVSGSSSEGPKGPKSKA